MNNREKWLIIAHCFNMDGRAASQTITDRLPQLMARGIEPVVLSAPTGMKDKRFAHYQVISPAPSGIRFEMRHMIRNAFKDGTGQSLLRIISAILIFPFYVLEKIFIHLDSQWSWFWAAKKKGEKIIEEQRPALIYSTGGPPSTHLAAYLLHKSSGIPWLAEIHDPLVHDHEIFKWQNYYFKRWLEKKIATNAAAVIYFTEKALANARLRTAMTASGYVVRPGAEPPGMGTVSYAPGPVMRFAHFGSLSEDRNLAVFFQAMHAVLTVYPEWRKLVAIDIYGSELDAISKAALQSYALAGILVEHGRLEYDPGTGKSGRRQVFEKMQTSDVLLLIHGQDEAVDEYVPSKVYEYLLTARPILGLADPQSELGTILSDNGHAVVSERDTDRLCGVLDTLISRWQDEGLPDRVNKKSYTIDGAVDSLLNIAAAIARKRA